MTLNTNFPERKKQPDSAFIPYPQPNSNNLFVNLIQLQPILGRPWPTIILEGGNSEPVIRLIEHRDKYLGHTTQVNVYVGVSYNRNRYRATDSWWMCVAHRDTNAPQPAPGTPPEYPAPIIIGELLKKSCDRWPNVNQPIPAVFRFNIEVFHQIIVRERLPWFLPFIIPNLILLEKTFHDYYRGSTDVTRRIVLYDWQISILNCCSLFPIRVFRFS